MKGAAFFFSNVVFDQAAGYFADSVSTRPLLHTWSLSVEEQFYLLFPPLLFCMDKVLRDKRPALLSAAVALSVASLIFSVWQVRTDPDAAFYLLPARAWELLTGALLAFAPVSFRLPRWCAELLAWGGALCIGYCFARLNRDTPFPGAWALLPCGGTAAIIASNLHNRTVIGAILAQRVLVLIGLLSYGLYLYHWPILAYTRYFLDHDLRPAQTGMALAATAAVSVLSYFALELPVRSGKLFSSRRAVFYAASLGLLSIGGFGIAAVNAGGFPGRFSGAALQYAAGSHDQWAWDACMPPVASLSADTLCRLGNATLKPSFLVWGDSHAAALKPAIDARAQSLGVGGWLAAYSRCSIVARRGAAAAHTRRPSLPCHRRETAERGARTTASSTCCW